MEVIKEILKKLSDALAQLQQLNELAREKMTTAREIQTESLQRLDDVMTREKAAALKEGCIRSNEKLDEEQSALETAQSDLMNSQKSFDRKCSARTAEIDQMKADIEAPLADLERREEALKEDKRTYKEKILSKLGSGGGGQ